MSFVDKAYLILVLTGFGSFTVVLGYHWLRARMDMATASAKSRKPTYSAHTGQLSAS